MSNSNDPLVCSLPTSTPSFKQYRQYINVAQCSTTLFTLTGLLAFIYRPTPAQFSLARAGHGRSCVVCTTALIRQSWADHRPCTQFRCPPEHYPPASNAPSHIPTRSTWGQECQARNSEKERSRTAVAAASGVTNNPITPRLTVFFFFFAFSSHNCNPDSCFYCNPTQPSPTQPKANRTD